MKTSNANILSPIVWILILKAVLYSVHYTDQFEYKVDYVWSIYNKVEILVILRILSRLGGQKGILCEAVSPLVHNFSLFFFSPMSSRESSDEYWSKRTIFSSKQAFNRTKTKIRQKSIKSRKCENFKCQYLESYGMDFDFETSSEFSESFSFIWVPISMC